MDFLQSLESFSKTKISTNFSLKNYNGYRVGGNADYFVQPNSVNQIRTIVQLAQDFKVDYKVIGNGTNLLFSDKGYRGVIICTKNIKGIITHNGRVICSCGERLQSLINYCCLHGFSGL
ncbi:MAG: FAD-binding protein, partial [Clostridia bacterium]|nr:FAD-binding protein [Clostridia bacterium]